MKIDLRCLTVGWTLTVVINVYTSKECSRFILLSLARTNHANRRVQLKNSDSRALTGRWSPRCEASAKGGGAAAPGPARFRLGGATKGGWIAEIVLKVGGRCHSILLYGNFQGILEQTGLAFQPAAAGCRLTESCHADGASSQNQEDLASAGKLATMNLQPQTADAP